VNYSCFNPSDGLYDYYVDGLQTPLNADLPVPKMPSAAGKVGVPAIDAGRPLPKNAQFTGRGWHARGMVVQCGRGSLGQITDATSAWSWVTAGGWKWVAVGLGAAFVVKRVL